MNEMIQIKNLTKIYPLYAKSIDRLKESLSLTKKILHENFYALNDISFSVEKGESLGIIGVNGSGKSTLLKIITGVLSQTSGEIKVNGKVSALLELGAGFNPEYTGYENIYLNGSLMGYSREEMDSKIDNILAFADIGEFINQPVKVYSSGLFARLAFAVAINVEPDILIVDEALAVGDVFFQNKCYRKFDELQKNGVNILFVSHDIAAIKKYCDRVLWLHQGKVVLLGKTETVCSSYYSFQLDNKNQQISEEDLAMNLPSLNIKAEKEEKTKIFPLFTPSVQVLGTQEALIKSFFIKDENENSTLTLEVNKKYSVHLICQFLKDIKNALFGFTLSTVKGVNVYATNNYLNSKILESAKNKGVYEVIFSFELPKIMQGEYLLSLSIAQGTQIEHKNLAWYDNVLKVNIINEGYNLALIEIDNDIQIINWQNAIFE